jgi:amino acid transporter
MSSPIQGSLAKDRLGVPSVVFFVMSAAAPLTVVAGVVTVGYATTRIIGIPFGFVTIAVILGIFSVGYVAMSRHITNAGAFYTYVSNGLGRPLGVGAAWMALLAYNALQVGLYGIIGSAVAPLLQQYANLEVRWWIIALVAWALVAILGVLRVDINGKVLALLLCAEIVIILIYDFADLAKPAGGSLTFDTLLPSNLFVSGFGAVLVLTFLGFTGFESAVVFSEESKNPRRTIALATYLSVAIIGGIYALSSWAMSVATGPANIVSASDQSVKDNQILLFGLATDRLPSVFIDIGSVLFATSVLAAMISFHNTVARYTFSLGRERVFPSLLSTTGRRSGAPVAGSLVQSLLGLAVIIIYAAFKLDPVVQLFYWLGTGGAFGILVLLAITSIAVVLFFLRKPSGENAFQRLIAPAIASVVLAAAVWVAVANFHDLLGVPWEHPVRWIIPAAFPAVAILGILSALILKVSKPEVYQAIGLGANSVSGLTTQSRVIQSDYAPQHGGTLPQEIRQ